MDQPVNKSTSFWVLFAVLFLLGLFLDSGVIVWTSHTSLTHSFIQTVASVIAFFVGATALYRFYTEPDATFMLFFVGAGFVGTTIIDFYHAMVTAAWFSKVFPNVPKPVLEWSWLSTRMYLALFIFFSLFGLFRSKVALGPLASKVGYLLISFLTVVILVIFVSVPFSYPIYPDQIFARPLELVPGVLFLITLIGYLFKGPWKTDKLEFWLVLFLITSVCTQFFFIDLSKQPHDILYIAAHVLKILSYAMVYIGVTAK